MSEFKIEKGVPIPEREYQGKPPKYPFGAMEVGDSFFIPCPNKLRANQKGAVVDYYNKKLAPKVFTRRAYDDGARIWRVK